MPAYRIFKAAAPFNESELRAVDYEQTNDLDYFAHPNHPPTKLVRRGHTDWQFYTVDFQPTIAAPSSFTATADTPNTDADNAGKDYFPQDASYVVTAYSEVTGQESRPSAEDSATNDLTLKRNYNTLSWSAVTGATSYRIYKRENQQAYGYIGNTDQLSFRDDNIGPDLSEGPPVADNPFADAGDYPGCVTFHEQRIFWARSTNRPNGVWGSRSADYENMDFHRPGREDDALSVGLVARQINVVQQMVSTERGLLALTSNNIFSLTGSNGDYITASPPPRAVPSIFRGSARIKPVTIDTVVFYLTAKAGEVHALGYKIEFDGIQTSDVSLFSRHLFENKNVVAWAYAERPGSNVVAVLDDGNALCFTWDQAQEVWGWTVWETDGAFRDVTTVFEEGEDRFYFIVEREVGGESKHFIERMASSLWVDQTDGCYLDCAKSFDLAAPATTITHLHHLEGAEVVVFADGNVIRGLTVSGGSITLPQAASRVHVGLPFTARLQTLPLTMQTQKGWNVAKPQAIGEIVLRVVKSRGLYAGSRDGHLYQVKDRNGEAWDAPDALISGDIHFDTEGTSGEEIVAFVESRDPVPATISAVFVEPHVS